MQFEFQAFLLGDDGRHVVDRNFFRYGRCC
jgi:hypothetical protein